MIYSLKLNINTDGYTPRKESEVINFIRETFDKTAVFVTDIEILDSKETDND